MHPPPPHTPDQGVDVLQFEAGGELVPIHLAEDVAERNQPALLRRKAGDEPSHDERAAVCPLDSQADAALPGLVAARGARMRVRPAARGRRRHRGRERGGRGRRRGRVCVPAPRGRRRRRRVAVRRSGVARDALAREPAALPGAQRRALPPAARRVAEAHAHPLAHKEAQFLRAQRVVRLDDRVHAALGGRHRRVRGSRLSRASTAAGGSAGRACALRRRLSRRRSGPCLATCKRTLFCPSNLCGRVDQ